MDHAYTIYIYIPPIHQESPGNMLSKINSMVSMKVM